MRNELERCQDVLVGVFWHGGGAHAMTLNSILNASLPNGRIELGFKDPWTGLESAGEFDPESGMVYNLGGAGGGRTAYVGVLLVVSAKEPEIAAGGPGEPILDWVPSGEPPWYLPIQLPTVGTWFFHMVLVNNLGNAARTSYVVVREPTGAAPGQTAAPLAFALEAAAPNPFRYRTELTYAVPRESQVSLIIYDAAGRKVRTLVDGEIAAGVHRVSWDGIDGRSRAAAAGIYFAKMRAGSWTQTRAITLLR
jgi:hypothetical protein